MLYLQEATSVPPLAWDWTSNLERRLYDDPSYREPVTLSRLIEKIDLFLTILQRSKYTYFSKISSRSKLSQWLYSRSPVPVLHYYTAHFYFPHICGLAVKLCPEVNQWKCCMIHDLRIRLDQGPQFHKQEDQSRGNSRSTKKMTRRNNLRNKSASCQGVCKDNLDCRSCDSGFSEKTKMGNVNALNFLCKYRSRGNKSLILLVVVVIIIIIIIIIKKGRRQVKEKLGLVAERYAVF